MQLIKERTEQYAIAVREIGNSYQARLSFRLNRNGVSKRLQGGGTTVGLAVINLLSNVEEYIEDVFYNGLITTKIHNCVSQKLIKSINDLEVTMPEIMVKVSEIINKINFINGQLLGNAGLQNNILPFQCTPNILNTPLGSNKMQSNEEDLELIKIEDFCKEWLKYKFSLCKKTEENIRPLSQKTFDSYCRTTTDIIIPYFIKNKIIYLHQVTDDVIKEHLKSRNGYDNKRHSYIVLSMLFQYAVKEKKVKENPMLYIDKPKRPIKKEEEKTAYIDPDRLEVWLDIFEKENTDLSLLYETMLLTGLRPEECCAISWKSIDFNTGKLTINEAYKDFAVYDDDWKRVGHDRRKDGLKTDTSYRSTKIPDRLISVLMKHKEEQKERFKNSIKMNKKKQRWSENEFVFLSRTFRPYVSDSLPKGLREIRKKYNLEKVTPYGLRHSFATFCSEKKMEPIVLSRIMGHSGTNMLNSVYIHVTDKRKEKALQEAYKDIN